MTAELTTLESLVFWAKFWGSIEEWQSCFDCQEWCTAHCFNLDQCWMSVVREQERAKLRSDGRWAVST